LKFKFTPIGTRSVPVHGVLPTCKVSEYCTGAWLVSVILFTRSLPVIISGRVVYVRPSVRSVAVVPASGRWLSTRRLICNEFSNIITVGSKYLLSGYLIDAIFSVFVPAYSQYLFLVIFLV
jgi:hypothetical protein